MVSLVIKNTNSSSKSHLKFDICLWFWNHMTSCPLVFEIQSPPFKPPVSLFGFGFDYGINVTQAIKFVHMLKFLECLCYTYI